MLLNYPKMRYFWRILHTPFNIVEMFSNNLFDKEGKDNMGEKDRNYFPLGWEENDIKIVTFFLHVFIK